MGLPLSPLALVRILESLVPWDGICACNCSLSLNSIDLDRSIYLYLSIYIYLALTSRRAAQVGPVGLVHSLRSLFPKPHPRLLLSPFCYSSIRHLKQSSTLRSHLRTGCGRAIGEGGKLLCWVDRSLPRGPCELLTLAHSQRTLYRVSAVSGTVCCSGDPPSATTHSFIQQLCRASPVLLCRRSVAVCKTGTLPDPLSPPACGLGTCRSFWRVRT